jgi:hypothetical protein
MLPAGMRNAVLPVGILGMVMLLFGNLGLVVLLIGLLGFEID